MRIHPFFRWVWGKLTGQYQRRLNAIHKAMRDGRKEEAYSLIEDLERRYFL